MAFLRYRSSKRSGSNVAILGSKVITAFRMTTSLDSRYFRVASQIGWKNSSITWMSVETWGLTYGMLILKHGSKRQHGPEYSIGRAALLHNRFRLVKDESEPLARIRISGFNNVQSDR